MANDPITAMQEENRRYLDEILAASNFLQINIGKTFGDEKPTLAVVLGSGLGPLATDTDIERMKVIPYSDIPNFPHSNVPGHAGEVVLARTKEGHPVVLMSGRAHYYEYAAVPGWTSTQAMRHITLPVRALKGAGIEALLLSNAAGGLNLGLRDPPVLMIDDSVINNTGANPLFGLNIDLLGLRFPPMGGDECNKKLAEYLIAAAKELQIDLMRGNYVMNPGPNYEFTAECQERQAVGRVHAVGMSTAAEVLAALHGYYSKEGQGGYDKAVAALLKRGELIPKGATYDYARRMQVIAVSCITNKIGPTGINATDHTEVLENGKKAVGMFVPLVKKFIVLYYAGKSTGGK